MKFKPLQEAPDKKLGVENDRLGPKKPFYAAKKMKIIFESDGFLQNVLGDF